MKTKITKIKLFLTVFFTVGFIVNGIFITIYNVDKSSNIGVIGESIQDLKSRNNKLTGDIAKLDSLSTFFERSGNLGFSETGMHLYFDQKEAVAQAR